MGRPAPLRPAARPDRRPGRDRLARWAAGPAGRFAVAVFGRLRSSLVESALVLAAQAFLALFPLLIVVYSVAPPVLRTALLDAARARFGGAGDTAAAVADLLAGTEEVRGGLTAGGALLVLASATAFARALQRMYQRMWRLPPLGLRGWWRSVAWLGGAFGYLAAVAAAAWLGDGPVPAGLVAGAAGPALWWWTPHLLLGGRVTWRALAPLALLTATAQVVVARLTAVVMPRAIRTSEAEYGPIGVVFAIESWLVVVCGVLVACTAVAAALAPDPPPSPDRK
ncbi:hypothetical protein GCM10010123_04820 [Pilimelia anulata]|uniref:Uncharacterized protein n=1 Tax=Pilimelia anulata TaxID=53371 RepID=A0A8J3F7L1_9ACTN|nr:YhjD/YihY/BrkB family envelope integrity protein [Pilimelia anulata]GGJ77797.1 hypothetical protein GCM10010123_04820 [Pilimelia anulata]